MPKKSRKQLRRTLVRSQRNYVNENELFNTFAELKRAVSNWCHNINKDELIAKYGYITNWHISTNITSLKGLFSNFHNFNEDLSGWNVSHIENMKHMFSRCRSFTGRGLSNWNVHSLKDATGMFAGCFELNCDLSRWNVQNLKECISMFRGCSKFDKIHSCLPWLDKNPDIMDDLFDPSEQEMLSDLTLLVPMSHAAPQALSSVVFDMDTYRDYKDWKYGGLPRGLRKGLRKTLRKKH
jgi:hypothetical protein